MEHPFSTSRIKLRHIQCFVAVAQLNNLQRAAERLSVTQPAISKTLSELEELLGVRLFDRGRKGATLTVDGQRFAPFAQKCLGSLREGVDELSRGEQAPTRVVLGILPTVAPVLLPTALARFRVRWPNASLRVVTTVNSELLAQLKAVELEFAIGRLGEPQAMSAMSFEHLFREPLAVVVRANHPLAGTAEGKRAILTDYPLLVPPKGTLIRQSADSVISALGISSDAARVESLSVSLNRALTLKNDMIWFVPSSVVQQDLADGNLIGIPIPFGGTDEPIGILRRTDTTLSPAAENLLEELRIVGLARENTRLSGTTL